MLIDLKTKSGEMKMYGTKMEKMQNVRTKSVFTPCFSLVDSNLSPCGFKESLVDSRFTTQELIV